MREGGDADNNLGWNYFWSGNWRAGRRGREWLNPTVYACCIIYESNRRTTVRMMNESGDDSMYN